MKILVTGGTGFLGKYVVNKLRGHRVIVFSRNAKGKYSVAGNVTDISSLEKAFPADVVIHLAASIDSNDPNLFTVNVNGTKNIVELCKKYRTKHIVYMSSTAAIGRTKIAREDSEKKPKTKYEKSKMTAEDMIAESGLNYTIIRAPVIFGPSTMWLGVIKAAKNNFPILGKGDNHFHVAYIEDVADLIAKCAGNRKSFGDIFHVATPDTPTYKEFYKMICDELGVGMTTRHMPIFAAKILSTVHGILSRIRGQKPKPFLAKENINRITRDRIVVMEKTKNTLGFKPKYNTKMAIHVTINQFKKSGMI